MPQDNSEAHPSQGPSAPNAHDGMRSNQSEEQAFHKEAENNTADKYIFKQTKREKDGRQERPVEREY